MTKYDSKCPACQGRGYYEAPSSDLNFGPSMELYPCALCTPVEPMPRWAKVLLGTVCALAGALLLGSVR